MLTTYEYHNEIHIYRGSPSKICALCKRFFSRVQQYKAKLKYTRARPRARLSRAQKDYQLPGIPQTASAARVHALTRSATLNCIQYEIRIAPRRAYRSSSRVRARGATGANNSGHNKNARARRAYKRGGIALDHF